MHNSAESLEERTDQTAMARVLSMVSIMVDAVQDVRQAVDDAFPVGSRVLLSCGREAVVAAHMVPEHADHGLFVKFDGETADYPRHQLPWRQIVGPISR